MRKKISLSIQKAELDVIDDRADELDLTRSSYLIALALKESTNKKEDKNRITDFSDKKKEPKPLD